jgi:predicted lactoylglutathione lyase
MGRRESSLPTTSGRQRRSTRCWPSQRAGATLVRPAARAEWGGYSGAFADPDGYVWEVAHNPDWKLADDGSIGLPAG